MLNLFLNKIIALVCLCLVALVEASAQASVEDASQPEPTPAQMAAQAITSVCQVTATGTSMSLGDQVDLLGLRRSAARKDISWVLPQDARLWEISGSDGDVVVFVYGPGQGNCGVLVPSVSRDRVAAELAMASGYRIVSEMELEWGVSSVNMFSAERDSFVDVLDYPASRTGPGVVKIELLTH